MAGVLDYGHGQSGHVVHHPDQWGRVCLANHALNLKTAVASSIDTQYVGFWDAIDQTGIGANFAMSASGDYQYAALVSGSGFIGNIISPTCWSSYRDSSTYVRLNVDGDEYIWTMRRPFSMLSDYYPRLVLGPVLPGPMTTSATVDTGHPNTHLDTGFTGVTVDNLYFQEAGLDGADRGEYFIAPTCTWLAMGYPVLRFESYFTLEFAVDFIRDALYHHYGGVSYMLDHIE